MMHPSPFSMIPCSWAAHATLHAQRQCAQLVHIVWRKVEVLIPVVPGGLLADVFGQVAGLGHRRRI